MTPDSARQLPVEGTIAYKQFGITLHLEKPDPVSSCNSVLRSGH
jgi:hypothetical protein